MSNLIHASQQAEMADYRAALASFDFQYDMADDHSVWAAGSNALARLRRMQRQLDPTGAIWMSYPGASGHGAPRPQVMEVAK